MRHGEMWLAQSHTGRNSPKSQAGALATEPSFFCLFLCNTSNHIYECKSFQPALSCASFIYYHAWTLLTFCLIVSVDSTPTWIMGWSHATSLIQVPVAMSGCSHGCGLQRANCFNLNESSMVITIEDPSMNQDCSFFVEALKNGECHHFLSPFV